jgi:hypothetical protein
VEGIEPDALDDAVPDREYGRLNIRPEVFEDFRQFIGDTDRLRSLECGHMIMERGGRVYGNQALLPPFQADGILKRHRHVNTPFDRAASCTDGNGVLAARSDGCDEHAIRLSVGADEEIVAAAIDESNFLVEGDGTGVSFPHAVAPVRSVSSCE